MRLKRLKDYKKTQSSTKDVKLGHVSIRKSYIVLAVAVLVGNVVFTIDASSKGAVLSEVEREIIAVEAQNRQLDEDIIREQSLTSLAEDVEELGLTEPENIVYIKGVKPIAQAP